MLAFRLIMQRLEATVTEQSDHWDYSKCSYQLFWFGFLLLFTKKKEYGNIVI